MTNETQKAPRRYEKMRDSGVEWIGMVPSHWEIVRARAHFRQTNERGNQTPILLAASQKFGVCPQDQLEGVVKVSAGTDLQQFKTVHRNDFIISLRSFQGGFELSPFEGVCSPAYQVFRADDAYDVKYLRFLFKDERFIDHINSLTVGIRDGKNIKYSDFSNSLIILPPLNEQRAIAKSLSQVSAKIDTLIDEVKAGIEEYTAWKASIIYEAVTKGLDPTAEMKDSGVEWIGEIPEEWYVCKTLFVLQMPITDGPHTTPELYAAGVPFVSAEAVSCGNGRIDFNHIRGYISEGFYQECCKKYIPQKDDIYMIKSGATTGKVAIVDVDTKFTIWSPLAAFRVNPKKVLPRYLFYFLQSPAYQKQVELGWSFGTQQNIGMRTLEKLKICVPPLSVQQEIIRYLDEKSNKLDAIIKEKTDLISDLESYKKSLIYEVVTGKRRVC